MIVVKVRARVLFMACFTVPLKVRPRASGNARFIVRLRVLLKVRLSATVKVTLRLNARR